MRRYFAKLHKVKPGIARSALKRCHKRLCRGLRSTVCKGRKRGIHNINARLRSHKVGHIAGTGGVVGVQMNRNINIFLELFNKGIRIIGEQKVSHILNADNIRTHFFKGLCHFNKVFLVMNGAYGVAYGSLAYSAVFFTALHCLFHIARIVERVENTDDINAVFDRLFNEHINHIVRIVLVAEQVLPAQKHLQLGVGHMLFKGAQSLPRVLVQKAHAAVKCSAAPAFKTPVSHRIKLLKRREHILNAHTRSRL